MTTDTPVGPPPEEPAPAGAPTSIPGETDADGEAGTLRLVQQCAWTLVWLAVLTTGLDYWGSWSAGAWAALLAPALALVALVGTVLVWTGPHPLSAGRQLFGLVSGLVAVVVAQGTEIHERHYYQTDSAAFNQVATRLFVDGHNPYTSTMAAAARLLHPAAAFWTYQVDGTHTLRISYPAGSFLLQAPAMALGVTHMVSDWVDLFAWLVTAVLVYAMVPAALRWLSPLLLLTGVFVGPFTNGGTDALFVPFLVIAVWRWDRWPARATPWLPAWTGPVALGVACSIKQTPWFCVPFLLVGVAVEVRRSGVGGRWAGPAAALRYGALVLGAFVVVNAPFIVWSPSAWLRGIFLPLVDPLVVDGQGVVALALHGLTGGVVMPWMSLAAVLVLAALVAAFALWEARLRRVWLFLVPFVLFVPARSLANYMTDFVPAALVAAVSVAATHDRRPSWADRRPWPARTAVGLPALAAAAAVVVALVSAPLTVVVDAVTVGGTATVDGGLYFRRVEVTVHNTSGRAVSPLFMVSTGGDHPAGFWRSTAARGRSPVAPGATTRFELVPTRYSPAPGHGQRWLVEAYTSSPNALSTSPLQQWQLGVVGH